ncbi:MAG: acetylglutamate kinase [Alicyclobacillus sp.]|nr:acetylglutamate kinase [Alicyclobacillus sp.]
METAVMKVGGSLEAAGGARLAPVLADRWQAGQRLLVVHGGGPRITQALQARGIELPFVEGQRLTTAAAVAVVDEVLCRGVNPDIVADLRAAGLPAVGLTSQDRVVIARPKPGMQRTGEVAAVDGARLLQCLGQGQLPVVAPVGVDADGNLYNINADLAAASVAGAVGAVRMVFCTDVPGIYEDFAARRQLYTVPVRRLQALQAEGRFHAGMIPKVESVLSALRQGVQAAFVVDGRNPDAVAAALSGPLDGSFALGTCVLADALGD